MNLENSYDLFNLAKDYATYEIGLNILVALDVFDS